MTRTITILVYLAALGGCGRAVADDDQGDAACPPADSGDATEGAQDDGRGDDGGDATNPYCATMGVICGATGDVQGCVFDVSRGCTYTVSVTVHYGGGVVVDSDGRYCDFGMLAGGGSRGCVASADGTDGMAGRVGSGGTCWSVSVEEGCP